MDHAYGKRRRHSPVSNFMQRVKMMVRGSSQRVAFVLFCAFCYLMYVAITGRATSASAGSPVSLDNARIAILTFVTAEHSYLHLSLSDKSRYAKKHAYTLLVDFEHADPMGVFWHKMVMIERVIREAKHDWILWLDFDTLFMNHTTRVTDIIRDALDNSTRPNEINGILTPDCWPLNAGVMLFRSCPATIDLLHRARQLGREDTARSEQDAIRDLIYDNDWDREDRVLAEKSVMIMPQRTMNAFPEEIRCVEAQPSGVWSPGDFIIHFAGAWAHLQEEDPTGYLMRKYAPLANK